MRKRANTRTPLRRNERNASDGARLLVVVVVVVVVVTVVVEDETTADGLVAAVLAPLEVRAVTSARSRCPTSALRTP